MDKVVELKRQPRAEVVKALQTALVRAERGEITSVVIAGEEAGEGAFFVHSEFDDRWRLLGALEYAKHGVLAV